ncbi:lytic transglycosylase domain-containing protein [Iodobacter ciconiae]|uniref:Transglycosylase n=1 Tax=Iodobacter ciconiae TaxID=2496266 RepID=A0A3S8ZW60_9NEIS|nr:lytic transglycosylase domain-containing protein [Iodobacter ciconiae]AZN37688.1 transglycosylase [Iodobacter ciconiae]
MKKILLITSLSLSASAHARLDLSSLREAARSRDLPSIAKMADASNGETLEMYPRYYWLSSQLTTVNENDAQSFLKNYDNSPLAERFRSEWLKELGRRKSWASFNTEYAKSDNPNNELQCLRAQSAIANRETAPLLAAKPLWFSAKPQSEACNPVFDALFDNEELNQADAWARIRLAFADNRTDLARQLGGRVGNPGEFTAKNISAITANPDNQFSRQPLSAQAGRELAIYALGRIARSNPDRAASLLSGIEKQLPAADQRYAWQQLGLIAAKKQHERASTWLSKGDSEGMDSEDRAWSIRAALRFSDWGTALARIEALPGQEQQTSTWLYWKARILKGQNKTIEANQLWAAAAENYDFYGLLAREELGPSMEPANIRYKPNDIEIKQIRAMPGVQRALALIDQDWRIEAIREWNWAMKGLTDQQLLAAAELARKQNWHDRSIYSAERTRQLHDFSLRYPTPYLDLIEPAAKNEGVDPAWVYGLIRQESRFISVARSGVGASGLMQLMPATAKWVAGKLGRKNFNQSEVNDLTTNISFGTFYLRYIWERLDDNQILATAGYNAGPGRARAWQSGQALDGVVYIETIPFNETRDYVKKVMANAIHYSHAFEGQGLPLKQRIAKIAGRGQAVDAP